MFTLHFIPIWFQKIFSKFYWKFESKEDKVVFLTFDDGPIPNVTDFVLEQLQKYDAKATFFAVGENILKNPEIFNKIINQNHAIGNHTFCHIKGWSTDLDLYLQDVDKCQIEIEKFYKSDLNLFRPPHGRITRQQSNAIGLLKYKIIMWNVLSCDYDKNISPQNCLKNTIKHTKPGSIIVFHDSLKAEKNLRFVLPLYLQYLKKANYKTNIISKENFN